MSGRTEVFVETEEEMKELKAKQTILVVDDMPINIQVLARALKSDYHVKIATNGFTAIEIANSEEQPDLILLDIMMPDMDGYQVCENLKDNKQTRDIPIIFISAKNEVENETKGLELGAVDYITKPFHLAIVKARVKTHLDLRRKNLILENLASLDGLTGIANRRSFTEVLDREWKRANRSSTPLSLILMDIDFFKNFNDNYGHTEGDRCLKEIARTLSISLKRESDFIGRYGGEEFVALLADFPNKEAADHAEYLRQRVVSLNIAHGFSETAEMVTLSLGVATTIPSKDTKNTPTMLLEAADKMLYEAKRSGRNRVRTTTL